MTTPEAPRPDIQKRREELQKLDPALTPAFWASIEHHFENDWWDRSGITREEYMKIFHGDEE